MIFVIFSGLVWVEGTKLLEPAGALQLMHAPETSHDLDKTRKIRSKTFWTGVSSRQHNIRYRLLCCWSDIVGSIHNLAGISIILDRIIPHAANQRVAYIGRLKTQPISDSFALMEKHVVKLCVASYSPEAASDA